MEAMQEKIEQGLRAEKKQKKKELKARMKAERTSFWAGR